MPVTVRTRFLTAPALALGATVVLATAAAATSTIPIKSTQVPVQASTFTEHGSCDYREVPSRTPPFYGWHFVLPGGTATFVSLVAHFGTAGDVTLPGPAGGFVQDGKGAVIYTATDDTLTGASATINGSTPRGDFVLSHTCLPTGTPSPTPSSATPTPSVSATETATPSESASASASASETPSAEVSGTQLTNTPSESVSPSVLGVKQTKGAVGGTGLATTGSPTLLLLVVAAGLIAGGVLLTRKPAGRYVR